MTTLHNISSSKKLLIHFIERNGDYVGYNPRFFVGIELINNTKKSELRGFDSYSGVFIEYRFGKLFRLIKKQLHELNKPVSNNDEKIIKEKTLNNWISERSGFDFPGIVNELDCKNGDITSLDGIYKFKNLRRLNIRNNHIKTIRGLENLTKLEFLDCSNNKLTNVQVIKYLKSLRWLNCKDNMLTHSHIKEIKKYCSRNGITLLI
ncbi:MAG: leucine-rich repeat domain-containing protein [Nanoarchaeota archaeon]|nr:leucine-rich repeat domain-containing protein [Nanoarchaeota archaeon]